MTERKPSAGMGNAAGAGPGVDLGQEGRKTPSPSAGPASAQDAPATWVPGCGGGGPLQNSGLEISMDYPWSRKESDMTEGLALSL